ncbi:hypothetical protein lerEdw1_008097 [Lerista edwardsae]|nr:hypothetical protein lerEdw1_008097 [Lerista edwardsae]
MQLRWVTDAENPCPEVMQELLKDGFHRDLLIRVNLRTADENTASYMVAVKVHLPKGLYVDPYELTSLQMHNLTEASLIIDDIDLEVPEYLATEVSVLIYMTPDPECVSCFRAILPLHCRYHRPAENGEKISLVLKNPEILIRSQKSLSMECMKEIEIEAPCSQKDLHTCRWDSMKFKLVCSCKRRIETADTSWAQTSSFIGMHSDSCYHNIVFQSSPFSFIQAWMPLLRSDEIAKLNKITVLYWNCHGKIGVLFG